MYHRRELVDHELAHFKGSEILTSQNWDEAILANFWKTEVGTLEIGCDLDCSDRAAIICDGEAVAFLGGSGGMLPRKILKIETVKYALFNVLFNVLV